VLNPGIAFTMLEASTQEQVNALEQGRADMRVGRDSCKNGPKVS